MNIKFYLCYNEGNQIKVRSNNEKMHVESEFAPLRSVVLAQSQFCLPDKFDEADTTFNRGKCPFNTE